MVCGAIQMYKYLRQKRNKEAKSKKKKKKKNTEAFMDGRWCRPGECQVTLLFLSYSHVQHRAIILGAYRVLIERKAWFGFSQHSTAPSHSPPISRTVFKFIPTCSISLSTFPSICVCVCVCLGLIFSTASFLYKYCDYYSRISFA